MAPISLNTSGLGIHESQIPEPTPLRIIKRSQTVSGSSTSNESLCGRRRVSAQSFDSQGSQAMAKERALTVRKIRKSRGSILSDNSMDSSVKAESRLGTLLTPSKAISIESVGDMTPRPSRPIRGASAGAFLKAQYHEGQGFEVRNCARQTSNPLPTLIQQPEQAQLVPTPTEINHSSIPQRKLSKSKTLFLRAIGGNDDELTFSSKRNLSSASRNTLVRRISKRRNYSSGSYTSLQSSDVDSLSIGTGALNINAFPIMDDLSHRQHSLEHSIASTEARTQPSLLPQTTSILYPHIIVTPEVSSVDAGLSVIWVAITVTGVLLDAAGGLEKGPDIARSHGPHQLLEATNYGKLHSMRIDLHPGQGCNVLQIVGNLHESKTISSGETQLILAKVRLGQVEVVNDTINDDTELLMADLQNHLGETVSSYLTVRLTYKHSGFPHHKALNPVDGMKLRMTRIETEATATIKRRNPESAWSPRTSGTLESGVYRSPVVRLVEEHFSVDKANDVKKLLIDDRSPISVARKFGFWAERTQNESFDSIWHSAAERQHTALDLPELQMGAKSNDDVSADILDDVDPARKIWSQMRLTSRGGVKAHNRGSISAGHYLPLEQDTSGEHLTYDISTPTKRQKSKSTTTTETSSSVDEHRSQIVEAALKNKRSVGADTLKSIAPSVVNDATKSKRPSGLGSGFGVGRAWGWAPAWW